MRMKRSPRRRSRRSWRWARCPLFTFPLIGHSLHLSDHAYGLWAGLAVDNTAEATAAGALYSDVAGRFAVLVKTTRNAMIGFVVLGYALYWSSRGQAQRVGNKARFLWQKFPRFVLGFLLISLLASVAVFTKPQLTALGNLSRWAFLLTFAGVGLRTNIRELGKQGWRPLAIGAAGRGGDCGDHACAGVWCGPAVSLLSDGSCHPGKCAGGAGCWVRFLWSLTLGVVGDLSYPTSQKGDVGHSSCGHTGEEESLHFADLAYARRLRSR